MWERKEEEAKEEAKANRRRKEEAQLKAAGVWVTPDMYFEPRSSLTWMPPEHFK